MSALAVALLLGAGVVLLFASVALRANTGSKYEIRTIDLALAIVPLAFWLIGTGRINKLAFGGVEIETAKAFIGASEAPIENQVTKTAPLSINDVVEEVNRGEKAAVSRIPRLIEQKTEALEFRLGYSGYWGPAIKTYFESLSAHAFLKYAIIHANDGSLFGIYSAPDLLAYFRNRGDAAYTGFAESLIRGDQSSRDELAQLPGFIPGGWAVTPDANKRSALKEMERLNSEALPVVDQENRFVGMVDRTRLTASLILDVAEKLETAGKE